MSLSKKSSATIEVTVTPDGGFEFGASWVPGTPVDQLSTAEKIAEIGMHEMATRVGRMMSEVAADARPARKLH